MTRSSLLSGSARMWVGAAMLALFAGGAGFGLATMTMHGATSEQSTAKSDREVLYWYDPMMPGQHFDKPGKSPFMDMQLVPKYADEAAGEPGVRIDPGLTQGLGMRTATAQTGTIGSGVSATGVIAFNERDVAIVQPRAGGFVQRTYGRAPDDLIGAGAPIVDLLVPEWGGAQQEYLAALKSGDAGLAQAARQRLALLGMPAGTIAAVEKGRRTSTVYTVTAPLGGTITTLDVRPGMTVSAGQGLATINGLGSVWLDAAVPEAVAGTIVPGQAVTATLSAFPGKTWQGRVKTIVPKADDQSRTLTVRVELPNPGHQLKPGMFAQVDVTGQAHEALLVPSDAVIETGKRSIVMLALDKGRFRPAEVRTGFSADGQTEILEGLTAGETVVVSGQFLIDSEASLSGMGVRPLSAAKPMDHADHQMANPAAPAYEARGTIQKIAPVGITLEHGPVPALKWPGMTMMFRRADPDVGKGLKVGDSVRFTFTQTDAGPILQSIREESRP